MNKDPKTAIVIFGASGDLTWRKLVPALYNLYRKERMPADWFVVGCARSEMADDDFRARMEEGVQEFAAGAYDAEQWTAFAQRLFYRATDLTDIEDMRALDGYLHEKGADSEANRIYYLAIAPTLYETAVVNLGQAEMAGDNNGWRRLVVEKPFGTDLVSAQELNNTLHGVFDEDQIYRIDHYLGKETAQNIFYFRFANTIFEPVWNRNYVDNVQITVTEEVDVGHRAGYYDQAGVVRDMFQNHLLQLLSLVAMEPPASFQADAVRNEKAKLFMAMRPVDLTETVRAQYHGYRDANGVDPDSETPTYAALTLHVDNWRWQGVPFYLRSGKALARKNSEIIVEFKRPPHLMFENLNEEDMIPNILSMCIQPDEGIHLKLEAKVPDSHKTRAVDMEFHYRSSFRGNSLPDAYERLLLDVMRGDASLFTRADGIEAAWRLVDPVIEAWQTADHAPSLAFYEPGSWGPQEANALLARTGRVWREGCLHE